MSRIVFSVGESVRHLGLRAHRVGSAQEASFEKLRPMMVSAVHPVPEETRRMYTQRIEHEWVALNRGLLNDDDALISCFSMSACQAAASRPLGRLPVLVPA